MNFSFTPNLIFLWVKPGEVLETERSVSGVVLGATGAIAVLSVLVLGCLIHIVKNRNKEVYDVARRGKPTGRATLAACRTYSLDVDELSPRSSATSRL